MKKFGEIVEEMFIATKKGWAEFAQDAGINQSSLSRIFKYKTVDDARPSTIHKLARGFGLSREEFLARTQPDWGSREILRIMEGLSDPEQAEVFRKLAQYQKSLRGGDGVLVDRKVKASAKKGLHDVPPGQQEAS